MICTEERGRGHDISTGGILDLRLYHTYAVNVDGSTKTFR